MAGLNLLADKPNRARSGCATLTRSVRRVLTVADQ